MLLASSSYRLRRGFVTADVIDGAFCAAVDKTEVERPGSAFRDSAERLRAHVAHPLVAVLFLSADTRHATISPRIFRNILQSNLRNSSNRHDLLFSYALLSAVSGYDFNPPALSSMAAAALMKPRCENIVEGEMTHNKSGRGAAAMGDAWMLLQSGAAWSAAK